MHAVTPGAVPGKSGQIPCFHNGRLATPQSLIPRKGADNAPKKKDKSDGVAIPKPIDENSDSKPQSLTRGTSEVGSKHHMSRRMTDNAR